MSSHVGLMPSIGNYNVNLPENERKDCKFLDVYELWTGRV